MNLPKWLTDILTTIVLPFAKLLGKNGLVAMFQNWKEKSPNWYYTFIICGYRALKVHVVPLAEKTPTEWDDESLAIVIGAMEKSAADNNVTLPDVTIHPALPAPIV